MESNLMEEKRKIYKDLLYKYSIGEYLKGQDFNNLLDLLKKHPRAVQKIGVGIKGLLIDRDGYGGRCFYLMRQDGTKEKFSYLKCLGLKSSNSVETIKEPETVIITPKPVKVKSESKPAVKKSNPPPDINIVKAASKSVKVTLVLDSAGISRIDSTGQKQVKLMITVVSMILEADINSKSYRKALAAIDELGAENCNLILQGSMKIQGKIESAGLAVQPKKAKEEAQKEVTQDG